MYGAHRSGLRLLTWEGTLQDHFGESEERPGPLWVAGHAISHATNDTTTTTTNNNTNNNN